MQSNRNMLLVGNGTYENRGCEAIVRGTMKILRRSFGNNTTAELGVYDSVEAVERQRAGENDDGLKSFRLESQGARGTSTWLMDNANRRLGTNFAGVHLPLKKRSCFSIAALEIGGDNYTLDYGLPMCFLQMDRYLMSRDLPVILWGASVGPFDEDKSFEPIILDHLRSLTAIFVRESASKTYLEEKGVHNNVHLMADPAFVMDAVPVSEDELGFVLPENALGINISPMIAKQFLKIEKPIWELTDTDLQPFVIYCAELVTTVSNVFNLPILLVPHVSSKLVGNDDVSFLSKVFLQLPSVVRKNVRLISTALNAGQLKYVIGKCFIFCGARTHSTIAAISSGVPTLSFSYSIKAEGINMDVFDTLDYCIDPSEQDIETIINRLHILIDNNDSVRRALAIRNVILKEQAYKAGETLASIPEIGLCMQCCAR